MAVHICLAIILKYNNWEIGSSGGFGTEQSFISKMFIGVIQKGKESEQKDIGNFLNISKYQKISITNY